MGPFHKKALWTCAIIVTFILFSYTFSFAQTDTAKQEVKQVPVAAWVLQTEQADKTLPAVSSGHADNSGQMPKPSTLKMGFIFYHFDYKEDMVPPLKSTNEGWLPGVFLSYTFKKNSIFYHRLYGYYAAAEITYDGSTQEGTPIIFSNDPQKFFKLQWDFGYPWAIRDNFVLTPYLGLGYRYWERGEAKRATSYTNYKEVYTWGYIPVGLRIDYDINDKWRVGGNVTANFMFGGNMRAYLSEVSTDAPDLDFSLGNEVGWYAEFPVTYRITNNWALTATPWYEYSAIGRSDTKYYYSGRRLYGAYEPSSKTNQFGISLSADLYF